jgi:phage baseplate assembly protein W
MNLHGSGLSFPICPDVRGSVKVITDRSGIISQAIADVLETRRGERVMMPDYGIPDFVFAVQDFSFVARLAYHLEQQILKYVPLVKTVAVKASTDELGRAVVALTYTEVGEIVAPKNLVFPVWQYIGGEE